MKHDKTCRQYYVKGYDIPCLCQTQRISEEEVVRRSLPIGTKIDTFEINEFFALIEAENDNTYVTNWRADKAKRIQ